jgi:hypothetical protein
MEETAALVPTKAVFKDEVSTKLLLFTVGASQPNRRVGDITRAGPHKNARGPRLYAIIRRMVLALVGPTGGAATVIWATVLLSVEIAVRLGTMLIVMMTLVWETVIRATRTDWWLVGLCRWLEE